MAPGESVEVAPGDVLVTRPDGPPPTLGWDERAGPLPAHLEERPDARQELVSGGRPFTLRITLADCFAAVRTVYVLDGPRGVQTLFRDNGMVPRRVRVPHEGVEEISPDDFLTGDRRLLFRLLDHARRRVDAIAAATRPAVTPLAAGVAAARLAAARAEIRAEVPRYFVGVSNISLRSALDEGVSTTLYVLDPRSPDVAGLRTEIRTCQRLFGAAVAARRRWADQWLAATVSTRMRIIPFGAPEGDEKFFQDAIEEEVQRNHPELAPLADQADAAQREADAYLTTAALEFPVLWRVVRTEHAEDAARLGREMLEALRSADEANRRFSAEIAGSPELAWRFPAVVRDALKRATVPEYSIAWRAAEQELAEEAGPRVSSQVGMFTGLAVMGWTAAAALVGASALAPPIGVALLIVDAVVNIIDAVQEYLAYRRQQAAADAVLDPSRSLAEPPSLLAAVLTIGLNLLSAVPGPVPGRAVVR
jgi:hypothetical protein